VRVSKEPPKGKPGDRFSSPEAKKLLEELERLGVNAEYVFKLYGRLGESERDDEFRWTWGREPRLRKAGLLLRRAAALLKETGDPISSAVKKSAKEFERYAATSKMLLGKLLAHEEWARSGCTDEEWNEMKERLSLSKGNALYKKLLEEHASEESEERWRKEWTRLDSLGRSLIACSNARKKTTGGRPTVDLQERLFAESWDWWGGHWNIPKTRRDKFGRRLFRIIFGYPIRAATYRQRIAREPARRIAEGERLIAQIARRDPLKAAAYRQKLEIHETEMAGLREPRKANRKSLGQS
jgi:hypothetical protein